MTTLLGFTPYWDYKPTNAFLADSPGLYTSDKILILSTLDKIHLKCDIIDGSVVNGRRGPKLFSFVLDKPAGYKIFCEPETIHYKTFKSVLNTITFYTENHNHEEVNFSQETFDFHCAINQSLNY